MSAFAWQELQIDPTTDARAIRSAYSRRLKSIDVDNDPEAFVRLRRALEVAQRFVAASQEPVGDLPPPPSRFAPDVRPLEPPASETAPTGREGEGLPRPPEEALARRSLVQTQARSLSACFEGGAIRRSREEIRDLAGAILSAIPALPLQDVAGLEQWWASLLDRTAPASDFLLGAVIERFGWAAKAQDWRTPPSILAALKRYRDFQFREEITLPDHRWAKAYRRLKAPPGLSLPVSDKDQARTRDLLKTIRAEYPSLMAELDQQTVAYWTQMKRVRSARGPLAFFSGIGVVFYILLFALKALHPPARTPATPNLIPAECAWVESKDIKPFFSCTGKLEVKLPDDITPETFKDAREGNPYALARLGWLYAIGGPPEVHDLSRGSALLHRAADVGSVDAKYWLGIANAQQGGETGYGSNLPEAMRWFAAAAADGNTPARYSEGLLRLRGVGGKVDFSTALTDFRVAAKEGYPPAMAHLGYLLERASLKSDVDGQTPMKLIEGAVAKGDPDGLFLHGESLVREGGQRALPQARVYLDAAAQHGSTAAMTLLGALEAKGHIGMTDHPRAMLIQAANLGNAEAMYDVGVLYARGEAAPRDLAIARSWFAKSALAGYQNAITAQGHLASGKIDFQLSAGCSLSCETRF